MFIDALALLFAADNTRRNPKRRRGNRTPTRYLERRKPLGLGSGFARRIGDELNRGLCWAFAASGTTLFKIAARLARNGILTRRQSLRLMCWSTRLHRIAIMLLRRKDW